MGAEKAVGNICFDGVNFGNGVRQADGLLCVRWPDGVYLKLENSWAYHLIIERDSYALQHRTFKKNDAQLMIWVERWVKVRPRFFTHEGGQLVKKKIWYDCEMAFVEILKKYTIPHEVENGVYTIHGYK